MDLAFFYYHYGTTLKSSNNKNIYYKKAIKIYQGILNKDKNNNQALHFLSRVFYLEKNKKAINIAKKAFELKPNFAEASNLADVYQNFNKFSLAELWYNKALKLTDKSEIRLLIKANLASCYQRASKKNLARKYAKEVIDKIPRKFIYSSTIKRMREIINKP